MTIVRPKINLIDLQGMPILQQLQLEEALLRADHDNWCLINHNSPPAIVMGISGQPRELIDQDYFHSAPIPVIRRFSGGGTVVVNEQTFFITLICDTTSTQVSCCPKKVLEWSEFLYRSNIPEFQLCENDYAINGKKFGGNAQYFRKERWLLHSSLLWDFHAEQMKYLQIPSKQPKYRENRSHLDFLCSLKKLFVNKNMLRDRLLNSLTERFEINEKTESDCLEILNRPHRKSTVLVVVPTDPY